MDLPLLFCALAVIISLLSFIYFKSYLKKRTSQERILAELQEEVNNILKSINETTERNVSLVEDSEKKLKGLLEEIEKRLKVYIREAERFRYMGNVNKNTAKNIDAETKTAPAAESSGRTYQDLGKNRYRLSKPEPEEAAKSAPAPEQGPAFPLPVFDIKPETEAKAPSSLPEQIRSLLRSGFSAPVVAARLDVSIAEVELAAALLERREE